MVRIGIKNINKVERFIINLPNKISVNLEAGSIDFMKSIKKSAKLRAPSDTGALRGEIVLNPVKKGKNVKVWELVSNAPYSLFQEEGYTPHYFFLPYDTKKLQGGKSYFVSKWTPFMRPAVDANINKLNNMASTVIKKSLN